MSKIGYARVSTDDQSLDLQIDALKEAGCIKIFEDKASGAKIDRSGLQHVMEYLREGDVLVVWRLDRLGRSLKHLVQLVEELRERGIGFQSITEGFDTTTPNGKLIFSIFAALAEFERNLIRERVQAGLKAARARGRSGGRAKKLNEGDLKKLKKLYASKAFSVPEICSQFQISKSTLYNYLNGEAGVS